MNVKAILNSTFYILNCFDTLVTLSRFDACNLLQSLPRLILRSGRSGIGRRSEIAEADDFLSHIHRVLSASAVFALAFRWDWLLGHGIWGS